MNAAFVDPEVRVVFASLVADDSMRILPFLYLPNILSNPKILMGYSDMTTLTSWLSQHGLVTFNGPSVLAGFAQVRHLPLGFGTHMRRMLTDAKVPPPYEPYPACPPRPRRTSLRRTK